MLQKFNDQNQGLNKDQEGVNAGMDVPCLVQSCENGENGSDLDAVLISLGKDKAGESMRILMTEAKLAMHC